MSALRLALGFLPEGLFFRKLISRRVSMCLYVGTVL